MKYLEERMKLSAMPPGEWAKPNSNTKQSRIDILRSLMKSGEAMPKTDGTEVIVKNTPENKTAVDKLENEKKTQDLETNKGTIKTNEIGKSKVFGGDSGGRGGGEAQTARAEIMQCVYCEHMVNNTRASFESIQPSDLEKAYNATSVVGATFEQVMELDPSWHYSGYWTAKRLVKDKLINNKMTFHRNDKTMNDIYKVKDAAVKNSNLTKIENDKWNPGDIWATTDKTISTKLPDASIQELNLELIKLFNLRKLVGISLKKVVTENQLKLEIKNKDASRYKYKFKSGRSMTVFKRKGGDIWRSKSSDVEFDGGSAAIRNKAHFAALTFELKLKTARGGGGGYKQISDSVKNRMKINLPTNADLKTQANNLKQQGEKSRYALPLYNMVKKIHPEVTKEQWMNGFKTKSAGDIHSKIAGIYVLHALVDNKKEADLVITDMVNYAGSTLEESSIYAKVYQ
tara:strand:- start:39 stop:1409 length:1371 start_codon:yes stop_codon:yes gene_type:complete